MLEIVPQKQIAAIPAKTAAIIRGYNKSNHVNIFTDTNRIERYQPCKTTHLPRPN